jgi:hypothetical protein
VSGLVEHIEGQPTPGIIQSCLEIAVIARDGNQTLENARHISAKAIGLEELPIIESGTIPQAEPRHEITFIEFGSFLERGQAAIANLLWGVVVHAAIGKSCLESGHITP